MVSSLGGGLLAASMLLGQVTEVQVVPPPTTNSSTITSPSQSPSPSSGRTSIFGGTSSSTEQKRPFFPWFSRDDRPKTGWFQSRFGRKEQQEPPLQSPPFIQQRGGVIFEGTPTSNPGVVPTSPTPLDFPKKMPSPSSQASPTNQAPLAAAPMAAKTVQQTNLQMAPSTKTPILPQLANKIGRDERFEWITGQLEMENGHYILYYATPETVDTHHGRIVMNPQKLDMSSFRRGDLISVRGDVVQRSGSQGPIYRASDAQLIERVK